MSDWNIGPDAVESGVDEVIRSAEHEIATLTHVIEDQNKIIAQQEAKIADLTSAKAIAQEERDKLRTRIASLESVTTDMTATDVDSEVFTGVMGGTCCNKLKPDCQHVEVPMYCTDREDARIVFEQMYVHQGTDWLKAMCELAVKTVTPA